MRREQTFELMRQADLVVATGSQTNVKAAYSSGTPALGVGAGNVSVIVDETADVKAAAERIASSKTFDNATSCSSENAVIAVEAVYGPLVAALGVQGGVLMYPDATRALERTMFAGGKLSPAFIAQSAPAIAALAGFARPGLEQARFLMVAQTGVGPEHPRAKSCAGARVVPGARFCRRRGAARRLLTIRAPVTGRPAFATTTARLSWGSRSPYAVSSSTRRTASQRRSFDNALPFSLSMGCGTWGGNSLSDNLNYRHFLNITSVVRPLPSGSVHEPTEDELFGAWRRKFEREPRRGATSDVPAGRRAACGRAAGRDILLALESGASVTYAELRRTTRRFGAL
jgi:sulfoacetaldehyde dehydrogenase